MKNILGVFFRLFAHPYGIGSALLMALAFPPLGFWIFVLPAVGVLALGFLKELEKKEKISWGFIRLICSYTLFVNLFGFYWLSYTLKEFGSIPWLISVPLMIVIFIAHCFVPSVFFGLIGKGISKNKALFDALLKNSMFFVGVWTLIFFVWDTYDFRVFPWTPVQGLGSQREILASVFYLKTWGWQLILFFAACAFARSLNSSSSRIRRLGSLWVLVPSVVGVPIGLKAIESHQKKYPEKQNVALIQGNIGNNEKRISKLGVMPTIRNVLKIHEDLISRIQTEVDKNLSPFEMWTFWPETSYPLFPTVQDRDALFLIEAARKTKGPHFVGTYETQSVIFADQKVELDFNIVAGFDFENGLLGKYQKQIRVYFGEYIPGDEIFPKVYEFLPQVPHFGKGTDLTGIYHPTSEGPVFVSLICYEILYRDYVRKFLVKIEKELKDSGQNRDIILLNPTNDSWYGKTSEPYQHSLLARWNVAEFGLPTLRPTNTGFSQVIAPWGEVLAQGPQDEMTVIFGDLPVSKVVLK
jgi:apolipoprotein N-acyltransferase